MPDSFSQLLDTGVLFVTATKRLLSQSKHSDPDQLRECLKHWAIPTNKGCKIRKNDQTEYCHDH